MKINGFHVPHYQKRKLGFNAFRGTVNTEKLGYIGADLPFAVGYLGEPYRSGAGSGLLAFRVLRPDLHVYQLLAVFFVLLHHLAATHDVLVGHASTFPWVFSSSW